LGGHSRLMPSPGGSVRWRSRCGRRRSWSATSGTQDRTIVRSGSRYA
jgi:hypothetical protein